MKLIRTEDAVGHVLCHDMTQIIPGEFKGARFRKGHIVTEEDIPVIFVIELSDRKTAEFIAGETGAEILTLQSAHNVTKEEFDSSVTYADLMEMNLAALGAALN